MKQMITPTLLSSVEKLNFEKICGDLLTNERLKNE